VENISAVAVVVVVVVADYYFDSNVDNSLCSDFLDYFYNIVPHDDLLNR